MAFVTITLSHTFRPRTVTGRPVSGVVRPGTQGRPGTMEQALKAPRTAKTARPVTSSTGRFVRLGTASMLSSPGGPFLNVSRLNLSKYAAEPTLAKPLFEYLFYHENDVRNALKLAALATQAAQFKDWYWKAQLGKCYYRLGLYRDAEKQFKSAMKETPMIDTVLFLGKVYMRLDQPYTCIETYKSGLNQYSQDISLLTALARIYEGINDMDNAVKYYKDVLKQDSINIEAIACIGTHHFYSDQPEIALRYYRRLLQMGVSNAELYTNIGLCCFYAQQFDLSLCCMERAVTLADNDTAPDVWYNIGHVALEVAPLGTFWTYSYVESQGNTEQAKALLQAAMNLGSYTFEPFYNFALLSYELGDLQSAYNACMKSLELFPEHADSQELMKRLSEFLTSI